MNTNHIPENESGHYYQDCKRASASQHADNFENQEKLYKISKKLVDL